LLSDNSDNTRLENASMSDDGASDLRLTSSSVHLKRRNKLGEAVCTHLRHERMIEPMRMKLDTLKIKLVARASFRSLQTASFFNC
jgi:hypothetical protein